MSRGRRYDEPKLNLKKVFAVILAIIVIIMFIIGIKRILTRDKETGKIASKTYFTILKDNKYGVMDERGTIVIDPSYVEMIIIPNSKKDVFLCTYDVNYDDGTYKTKALNSKNEEIYKQYEQIEPIQNKDKNNNLWYESDVLKIKKEGKYGLIDLTGKELLPAEYDLVTGLEGIKNTIKISKDNKFGIVGISGAEIIKPEYLEISGLGKDNKSGFIIKTENQKYGIVDFSGKQVLEAKYDEITNIYGNDLYVVKINGKQTVINKDGKEMLNTGFDEITAIMKNAENGVIYKKNNKYGVMKVTGEDVTKSVNPTIEANYEDLKEAKSGILIAKKDGKYGIIDLENKTNVDFKYSSITYNEKADVYITEDESFNNEILDTEYNVKQKGILTDLDEEKGYIELKQEDEYKYYNFKFEEKQEKDIFTTNTLFISKKNGKYGFVDKDGKVVVDYIFDDATKQNEFGYSAIKKDGKWGSIDNNGTVVQEPTYKLDDYLKIDFIGRWHLGKDINMNYYNQMSN